jgi:hypothetical protein
MNTRKRSRFFDAAFRGALGLLAGITLLTPSLRAHPASRKRIPSTHEG